MVWPPMMVGVLPGRETVVPPRTTGAEPWMMGVPEMMTAGAGEAGAGSGAGVAGAGAGRGETMAVVMGLIGKWGGGVGEFFGS